MKSMVLHRWLRAAVVLGTLPMAGCASAPQNNDPLEPLNRAVFKFNRVTDELVLKPAAQAYDFVVPDPGKSGVRNFLNNLRSPVVLANDILQGEGDRAGNTLGRFMINTIFGLGLFDVATDAGYPNHYEDFGQTLAVWGLSAGPYLMLPFFGPSNPRDASGLVVDSFVFDPFGAFNPIGLNPSTGVGLTRTVADAVDRRYRLGPALDDVYANSLDPYTTFRTVYRQRRAIEIRNQAADEQAQEDYDSIFEDPAQ